MASPDNTIDGIEKLEKIKSAIEQQSQKEKGSDREEIRKLPKKDAYGRAYATGKRKNAISKVWLTPGKGRVTINGKDISEYFARPILRIILTQPLIEVQREGKYDIKCSVLGGGLSGQAGAIRHGISKALVCMEPDLRGVIKALGFLTRDSRVVERKKYGRHKARRGFQFSKR